jgi:hypothetical protein
VDARACERASRPGGATRFSPAPAKSKQNHADVGATLGKAAIFWRLSFEAFAPVFSGGLYDRHPLTLILRAVRRSDEKPKQRAGSGEAWRYKYKTRTFSHCRYVRARQICRGIQ